MAEKKRTIIRDVAGEGKGRIASKAQREVDREGTMPQTIKPMNRLTKIFDLMREGKKDAAIERLEKLSPKKYQEFVVVIAKFEQILEADRNPTTY